MTVNVKLDILDLAAKVARFVLVVLPVLVMGSPPRALITQIRLPVPCLASASTSIMKRRMVLARYVRPTLSAPPTARSYPLMHAPLLRLHPQARRWRTSVRAWMAFRT